MNVQGLKPRSVPSKIPYIQDLLQTKKQIFVALTETWLREQKDAELTVEGYTLYRQDRQRTKKSRRGRDSGGAALYLRDDLTAEAEVIFNFSSGVIEAIGVHIKSMDLLVINVYRQPDDIAGGHRSTNVEFKQFTSQLRDTMSTLPTPTPDVLLCGDFNLPHVSWPNGVQKPGITRDEQLMVQELLGLAQDTYLTQQIVEPTHKQGNTLDLLFTNNQQFLHNYQCVETIFSDHYIVECSTNYSQIPTNPLQSEPGETAEFDRLNFFSEDTNWSLLEMELAEHDWEYEFRSLTPNQMLATFLDVCFDISKKHTPLKKRFKAHQSTSTIPRDRKNLMRRRSRINYQLLKAPSEGRRQKLREEAKNIERSLKHSYDNDRKQNEEKAVSAIRKNIKYFFSYAKKYSKQKSTIGPLVDNGVVTDARDMANILAKQYESVFSDPKEPMKPARDIFPDVQDAGYILNDIYFTEDDIDCAIQEISETSAAGPDRFPAILLKRCSKALSHALSIMWRRSLDTGTIPDLLKTANIVPIHKGGNRGTPKNYRPVALTSHLIKVFEKIIRNHLVSYLEEKILLNPGQHGFRSGRSCLSQLVTHFDNILRILEKNYNVDVIYLDFAKAFDKVDFQVTLKKMKNLGICGKLGKWIHAFLVGRSQTVVVNGSKATPSEVRSGVPQGSVLGPLLFLILIGDIDAKVATSFVSSFADDTRVGRKVSSETDAQELQADLDSIYKWAVDNNMEFNCDKFECVRYGNNKAIQDCTSYKSSSGCNITVKRNVRDLGIIMSDDASFTTQISNVVQTANSMCGWILRTFQTRAPQPMLSLWKSLVLSKLDYCSQLWCPVKSADIKALEQVQKSFIRKIAGSHGLNYWEQLGKLHLYSLERRRERYIIIYAWRILEQLVPNVCDPADGGLQAVYHIRRGRLCVVPKVARNAPSSIQGKRYASLAIRGPRLYNLLPLRIRNTSKCSTEVFKRRLDKFLATVPDEPLIPGYTAMRRADSNSLLDMAQFSDNAPLRSRREVEDEDASTSRGGHPWSPWD